MNVYKREMNACAGHSCSLFMPIWRVPSIPTILSIRFMLNPEWGIINSLIFRFTGADGPNWLNDPTIALGMAMLVHIWKSLPFWTLILITGRLAISHDLFEAAEVGTLTRPGTSDIVPFPRKAWYCPEALSTISILVQLSSQGSMHNRVLSKGVCKVVFITHLPWYCCGKPAPCEAEPEDCGIWEADGCASGP